MRKYAKPYFGTYACGHEGEFYFLTPREGKELEEAKERHLKRVCPDCFHKRNSDKYAKNKKE